MRPSRPLSWVTVGSSTSHDSWGVTPRRSAKASRIWRGRTTWTAGAPKKGGGRKRLIEIDSALNENFLRCFEDHTAGDPMRTEVKWTNLSRRQIAERMAELGTRVSRDVVSQLLRKHGYRKRKALKKKTMGHHRGSERPVREDRPSQEEVLERRVARDQHRHEEEGIARRFLP